MKILYYRKENRLMPGILTDKGIIDFNRALNSMNKKENSDFPLTKEKIEKVIKSEHLLLDQSEFIPESDLAIAPCVPRPSKIICIGLNYKKHALESGMVVPPVPVAFTKYNNTLTEYSNDITLGTEGEQFDYEIELGVIIGRKCKHVLKDEALNYVLGYCVANDLSCRDLQFKTSQWLLGKSLDQFLPLGKYVVTSDEVGDPQNLQLKCWVNGELRQNSNTGDMIFSVAEIIAFLSKYMTLDPGDLILTGTPEGVIMGLPEKKWLKPGDIVRVEIEKLGYTENKMI
jgi:2-keto-4-pentenoate hydratase/2-oxohepta-3-ene-1,7-dioic acid hydratase in catechol pathway